MSIEESYFRAFVAAVAAAAAVAFVVIVGGILFKKRIGDRGLGIVGGLAVALGWIAAQLVFRGAGVWADVARGGNGWKRALWPIEATDRLHAAIALCIAGGLVAAGVAERTSRGVRALTWAVRIATVGSVAWVAAGPLATSVVALIVVGTLVGIAWWAALEESAPAPDGALLPMTAAVCSMGFGALMLMHYATTLGLVAMCGAAVMCVVAIFGAFMPRLTRGPMVIAVIVCGWVWLIESSLVYAMHWPVAPLVLSCTAPAMPALLPKAWGDRRPKWNRWVAQLALTGAVMGVAVGWVFWNERGLRFSWPY